MRLALINLRVISCLFRLFRCAIAPLGTGCILGVLSREFGSEIARWRTEDRSADNHKCLLSRHSSSRMSAHPSSSGVDLGLLSSNATEPSRAWASAISIAANYRACEPSATVANGKRPNASSNSGHVRFARAPAKNPSH